MLCKNCIHWKKYTEIKPHQYEEAPYPQNNLEYVCVIALDDMSLISYQIDDPTQGVVYVFTSKNYGCNRYVNYLHQKEKDKEARDISLSTQGSVE